MNYYRRIQLGYFSIVGLLVLGLVVVTARCSSPAMRTAGTPGKLVKFVTSATVGDSSLDESGATGVVSSKSVNATAVALVDGASIATDASTSNVFTVTLAGSRTLANPTNLTAGGTYLWVITQGGGGSNTLAYGNAFTWPGGVACVLSTAVSAVDIVTAVYDGVKLRTVCNKAFQ